MTKNDEARNLALALMQVVQMWSNRKRYESFLLNARPGEITEQWFRWFAGAWNVARTIKDGQQERVREYLDGDFRKALLNKGEAETIDAAARYLQQQGWSSGKNGKSVLPISLVSKIAFFLCPAKFVPLDSYAVDGLNHLLRSEGARKLKGKSYSEYLASFNEHYARMEPKLKSAMKEQWVADMAHRMGCPPSALTTIAMRRKLFDDYLMHIADYRK